MEWLLIFLLIIIAFFCYLIFAPFYLEINSINGLYGVRFHRLAYAKLIITDSSLIIDLWVAGWEKQIDLFAKTAKAKQIRKSDQAKKKKKPFKISFDRVKAVLKSFKVTKCCLNIDSGNVQLNGILYPVFYWLSKYSGKQITINFLNQNEIILEIRTTLASTISALFFHSITFKKQKSWTTLMNYSAN